jgi:MFS family permease
MAAVPSIIQLLQIPSVALIRRIGERKTINVLTQVGNRIGVLVMILIPFVGSFETGYVLLIGAVGLQGVFTAIGSPSWNSWLRDLVPEDQMGRFFSKRLALGGIAAITISLAGGFFIGQWEEMSLGPTINGYAVLFLVAFIAGIIAIAYTVKTPEPKMNLLWPMTKFRDLVWRPFQDPNFRSLLWFSVAWTLSTSLAASFFAVYLLARLGLDLPIATILTAITQVVSIFFFRFWGRLSDRYSNKSILLVTTPLFTVSTFLWTFTSVAETYSFLLPLLVIVHTLSGFSAAGVNLTSANIGLKLAPRGEAASYLAARGAVIAIAGTIGPLVGGVLADLFAERELLFSFTWTDPNGVLVFQTYRIIGLDFVFLLSVIVGVYALHRLAYVKETGEVEAKCKDIDHN